MDRPADEKKVELSIIVVNCDTAELTMSCIHSIYQHKPSCSFEVILLNNSPERAIEPETTNGFSSLRVIETGKNLGFSTANNIGIFNSHGDYILLMNSDAALMENSLDKMLDYMEKNEHVGVLGPREVDREGRYRLSCGVFPNFFSELIRKVWHYRLSLNDYNLRDFLDMKHARMKDVDWVSGSCMMLRRRALHDSRLLDENFFMYFEDVDLCERLWEKRWEVHYFPETTVIHYGGASARRNLMLVMTEYRRSEVYFSKKHYGWLGGAGIRFFLFWKYIYYFIRQTALFFLSRSTKEETYTTMLLIKKVLQIVFTPVKKEFAEPVLSAPRRSKVVAPD